MKQQIRKPENWQDFEELCKMLWGEIWQCAEIKKNGRGGQDQKGVDVYGVPKGEKQYFGIQCKGKDEYTKSALTETEIDREIEKAKRFSPKLQKFYFATTANKDERIEEVVRLRNVSHLEQGLFEVHLFSWEDIAYLIDQHKRTHDWYIRKIDFAQHFKVAVSFEDGTEVKEYSPIMLKNHISYRYQAGSNSLSELRYYRSAAERRKERNEMRTEAQPTRYFINGKSVNKSSCVFSIKVSNIGHLQLENWKLYLTFEDDIYTSAIASKNRLFLDNQKYSYDIKWVKGSKDLEFKQQDSILVQNDSCLSDKICLRPDIEYPACIFLHWKLVAKDFSETGVLKIILNTRVREKKSVEVYDAHFEDEIVLENYTGSDD